MKLSVWVTVSDLVPTRQTLRESAIDLVDKKHAMFRSTPHSHVFQSLKHAGVDGVELLIPLFASDGDIDSSVSVLNQSDMPVLSIHQALANTTTIDEITRLSQIAQRLSAKVVVLHIGTLGGHIFDAKFSDSLKEQQVKYQVTFGIENSPKMFPTAPSFTYQSEAFSSAIKRAGLSITFDTTHLAQAGGDITQFYLANKESIINIHISDYKKSWFNTHLRLQDHTHLPLGAGELPISKLLESLKANLYSGLLTMEINGGLKQQCDSVGMIDSDMGISQPKNQ